MESRFEHLQTRLEIIDETMGCVIQAVSPSTMGGILSVVCTGLLQKLEVMRLVGEGTMEGQAEVLHQPRGEVQIAT